MDLSPQDPRDIHGKGVNHQHMHYPKHLTTVVLTLALTAALPVCVAEPFDGPEQAAEAADALSQTASAFATEETAVSGQGWGAAAQMVTLRQQHKAARGAGCEVAEFSP